MESGDGYCVEVAPLDIELAALAAARNEARVRLAVESGIPLIFVDACHMQFWEMGYYVKTATTSGYEVSFADPDVIFEHWKEPSSLRDRLSNTKSRLPDDTKVVASESGLKAMLATFEPLPP